MLYPLSSDGGVEVYRDKPGEMSPFFVLQMYGKNSLADSQKSKNDSHYFF